MEVFMSMAIAVAGNAAPPQELPPEQASARKERNMAAVREFTANLPGNREVSEAEIQTTATNMEKVSLAFNHRLQFQVDRQSKDITVKVIDRETDKVIRELPPEELRRLHTKIRETIGFLFDQTV
jgi:flagellar protein FlaG